MKEKLMNNFKFKVAAFLAACAIWLIVVNVDDPIGTKTIYGVPVTTVNEDILADSNQTYQVADGSSTVNVTVKAKRSSLDKITASNIVVTADFADMVLNTQVPISVTVQGVEVDSATANPTNLNIVLEDEETKKFPIVAVTTGTVRDGNAIGTVSAVPEMVSIRGAESVIESIARAEATVSVSGLSEDAVIQSELVLYDADNNVIDQTGLQNNLGEEGVSVSVQILKTKKVSLNFDTSMIGAAEGYSFAGISAEPQTVVVYGEDDALEDITEIQIPAKALKTADLKERKELVVDIADYIPENVKLVDENASSIVVTISIDKDGTTTYNVTLGAITVKNLDSDLSMEWESAESLDFIVRGPSATLASYDIEGNLSVDLSSFTKEGTYTVNIDADLPAGCSLEKTVTANIILSEK